MAAPVTRQVSGCAGRVPNPTGSDTERGQPLAAAVAELPVLDASGRRVTFGALFRERRAVVVFVRVSTGRAGPEGPLVSRGGCNTSPGTERLDLLEPGCYLADVLFCIVVFQHFLCYVCKEYVEDLAKIPKSFLRVSFPSEQQWWVQWGELWVGVVPLPSILWGCWDPRGSIYVLMRSFALS